MEVIFSPQEMQRFSEERRGEGKNIAFVPTMGFLHRGHLSLMEEGRRRGDILVVSIFVNPTQFGEREDYEEYPRDLERDERLAGECGVDIIFVPSVSEMYPPNCQTFVSVEKVTKNLCGISRPTHFRGVTTVVTKLFNIVKPHIAIFGKKDFQQLVAIQRMVKDLNFDIEIIDMPTVREEDGLAMSSRNSYLNPEERKAALCLFSSLKRAEELFEGGERNAKRIVEEARRVIEKEPLAAIDYVKICDAETLEDLSEIDRKALLALAVKIGKTRLIDNLLF